MSSTDAAYAARRPQRPSSRPLTFLLCVLGSVLGVLFVGYLLFMDSTVDSLESSPDFHCSSVVAPTKARDRAGEPTVRDVVCANERTRRLAWAGIAGVVTVGCAFGARRLAPGPMFGDEPNRGRGI